MKASISITQHGAGLASIVVDGVEVANKVRSARLELEVNQLPHLELVYNCEPVTFDGKAEVIHFCPQGKP